MITEWICKLLIILIIIGSQMLMISKVNQTVGISLRGNSVYYISTLSIKCNTAPFTCIYLCPVFTQPQRRHLQWQFHWPSHPAIFFFFFNFIVTKHTPITTVLGIPPGHSQSQDISLGPQWLTDSWMPQDTSWISQRASPGLFLIEATGKILFFATWSRMWPQSSQQPCPIPYEETWESEQRYKLCSRL